ncbi:MAG: SRPBCC family protein [Saprospiraceae bacterium]
MTAQQNIFIKASPSKIFAYLMDVNNRTAYIPALEEVILLDKGPIRKGSKYIEVANIAGRKLKTTYEVIEFEENKHTAAKTLKSIFPIRADLDLEGVKGGTNLIISLNFQLKGIFKFGASVVKGIVNQQARGILEKIKTNLE